MVSGVLPAVPFLHYFLDANQFEYLFCFILSCFIAFRPGALHHQGSLESTSVAKTSAQHALGPLDSMAECHVQRL
jgi:hypothetical protein